MDNAPLRYFAMVRGGLAFDWLTVSPQLEILTPEEADGDEEGQTRIVYPAPPIGDDIDLVIIERGFDPLCERVDLGTGKIEPDLGRLAAALHAQIDAGYEARVEVPGPVKSAEYAAKLAEARTLIDGGEPGPMLIAEAEAGDVLALAEQIVARAQQAADALATKAAARRAAKLAVTAAADADAMRAVVNSFIEGMRQ